MAPPGSVTELKTGAVTGLTVRATCTNVALGKVAVMVTIVLTATEAVLTLKVPIVAPPGMLTFGGTVAALELSLIKVTVKPAAGAGLFRVTVPNEVVPAVTGLGLSVSDAMMAGLTVNVPLVLLAPSVAVTVTMVCVATPTVVAVNVCDVIPAPNVTEAGTVTEGSPLLKETVIPPAGAGEASVTVPMELVPPVTAEGLKLTEATVIAATTVTFAVTMVVPVVAVTVTGVVAATVPAVTTKVWLFVPTGTTTFKGTGNAPELLLVSPTVSPPAGAGPLIVTVPVVICPVTTVEGLKLTPLTTIPFVPVPVSPMGCGL